MSRESANKPKVAVIVGQHPFDVISFQKLFNNISGIEPYHQNMEQFTSSPKEIRESYGVLLFYNFHRQDPTDQDPWYAGKTKSVLESLGDTKQGIFLLHHAILAYPDWRVWSDLCGIQDRKHDYHVNQNVHYIVADKNHPITSGLADFDMTDETYTMNSAGGDSRILITTDHPLSMKTIAWSRKYKNADVFCYESGHDDQAYGNENFRKIVRRGILWLDGIYEEE